MKPLKKLIYKVIGKLDEKEYNQFIKILEDAQTGGKTLSGIDDFNLAVKFLEHPDSIHQKPH